MIHQTPGEEYAGLGKEVQKQDFVLKIGIFQG